MKVITLIIGVITTAAGVFGLFFGESHPALDIWTIMLGAIFIFEHIQQRSGKSFLNEKEAEN